MSGKRGRRQVTRQENLGEISESHVHSQSLFPEHLGTCHTTRLACEEQSPGFSSAVLGRERSRTPKETQACELRGHPLPAWLHQHWLQKPLTAQEDPVILENYQRFVSELAGEAQSRQFVPQFLTLSFNPLQTEFFTVLSAPNLSGPFLRVLQPTRSTGLIPPGGFIHTTPKMAELGY